MSYTVWFDISFPFCHYYYCQAIKNHRELSFYCWIFCHSQLQLTQSTELINHGSQLLNIHYNNHTTQLLLCSYDQLNDQAGFHACCYTHTCFIIFVISLKATFEYMVLLPTKDMLLYIIINCYSYMLIPASLFCNGNFSNIVLVLSQDSTLLGILHLIVWIGPKAIDHCYTTYTIHWMLPLLCFRNIFMHNSSIMQFTHHFHISLLLHKCHFHYCSHCNFLELSSYYQATFY